MNTFIKGLSALPIVQNNLSIRNLSSSRASITRIARSKYMRMYPALVVQPDGSTFTIRYHEPRQIIKLPFDITGLSEQEQRARLERRKPKTRIDTTERSDDIKFDARKYLKYMKKK